MVTVSALEKAIYKATNQIRQTQGIPPLKWDSRLLPIAREHSKDMAQRQFFAHTNPSGESPTHRGKRHGYQCRKTIRTRTHITVRNGLGENLFQNQLYDAIRTTISKGKRSVQYNWSDVPKITRTTLAGWMQSPPHRQSILTSAFTLTAIGVFIAKDDKVYITQLFC